MTFHIAKSTNSIFCGVAMGREPMYFPADRVTDKVLADDRTCRTCIERWREAT